MRAASSASRTCRALASASEYTATVATPSRRAVLITRQAISPRFAIRIFLNIPTSQNSCAGHARVLCVCPNRATLVEEGAQSLPCRGPGSQRCYPPRGVLDHRIVDWPVRYRADQVGRSRLGARTSGEERRNDRIDLRIQFLGWHHLVDEPDFMGARGADPLASLKVPVGLPLTDRAYHIRPDHRRNDAEPHLRSRKLSLGRGDADVADGSQPHATAERGAVHTR